MLLSRTSTERATKTEKTKTEQRGRLITACDQQMATDLTGTRGGRFSAEFVHWTDPFTLRYSVRFREETHIESFISHTPKPMTPYTLRDAWQSALARQTAAFRQRRAYRVASCCPRTPHRCLLLVAHYPDSTTAQSYFCAVAFVPSPKSIKSSRRSRPTLGSSSRLSKKHLLFFPSLPCVAVIFFGFRSESSPSSTTKLLPMGLVTGAVLACFIISHHLWGRPCQ
ncbi:hypothetical protein EDB86DRAFT_2944938 [Lactarius hatsudake]|nr:hypothetical protein EDB86DRAFT_2944938 [Lactarius hatsudake]